jgi:hypothetical protein
VGIGSPPEGWDPADYVLGKFAAAEQAEMGQVLDQAAKTVLCWAESGIREAMNRFNSPGGERTKKGNGIRGDIRGAGPKSSDSGEPGSRRKNGRGLDGGSGELAD